MTVAKICLAARLNMCPREQPRHSRIDVSKRRSNVLVPPIGRCMICRYRWNRFYDRREFRRHFRIKPFKLKTQLATAFLLVKLITPGFAQPTSSPATKASPDASAGTVYSQNHEAN